MPGEGHSQAHFPNEIPKVGAVIRIDSKDGYLEASVTGRIFLKKENTVIVALSIVGASISYNCATKVWELNDVIGMDQETATVSIIGKL